MKCTRSTDFIRREADRVYMGWKDKTTKRPESMDTLGTSWPTHVLRGLRRYRNVPCTCVAGLR